MSRYGEKIDDSTVRFVRTLPGPIERVWAWLTEEDKRRQWFAAGKTELRVGGKSELHFNNSKLTTPDDEPPEKYRPYSGDIRFEGKVIEIDPPRLIKFSWPEADGAASEVTFELKAQGDKVVLTLTQAKLATKDAMLSVSGGWHIHLDLLEAQLSAGKKLPAFWSRLMELEGEYAKRLG